MKAVDIHILSHIGKDGISAMYVQDILNRNKDADTVNLIIDSAGGDVSEGYTIYNLLKNSGKKINTNVVGMCASIATMIALAGDNITMPEYGRWLVHLPMVDLKSANRINLEKATDLLNKIEEELITLYANKTKQSRDIIKPLMEKDEFMTSIEAKDFGFIDEVKQDLKAVAYYDNNNSNNKTMEENNKVLGAIDLLAARLDNFLSPKNQGAIKPKNAVVVKTSDDTVFDIYVEVAEGGDWVGSRVYKSDETRENTGESIPDGTYDLSDGKSITVADGVITAMTEATNEMDELKKEVENIKNALAEKDQIIKAKEEELTAIKATADKKETEAIELVTNLSKEVENIKNMSFSKKPQVQAVAVKKDKVMFEFNKGITVK